MLVGIDNLKTVADFWGKIPIENTVIDTDFNIKDKARQVLYKTGRDTVFVMEHVCEQVRHAMLEMEDLC